MPAGGRPRAAHVTLAAAAVAGALLATTLTGAGLAPAWLLVRDAAGLGGLAALGAVSPGAQRAWLLPVSWALLAVPVGGTSTPRYLEVFTWFLQPPGTTTATVTATALAVSGTILHAALGARQ